MENLTCGTCGKPLEYLTVLRRHKTNNVVAATLRTGFGFRWRDRDREVLERVVRGSRGLCVTVGGNFCDMVGGGDFGGDFGGEFGGGEGPLKSSAGRRAAAR